MANALPQVTMDTPVGELEWVTITGDGKPNMSGTPNYWATLVLDPNRVDPTTSEKRAKSHKDFIDTLNFFWEENKPKGKYEIKGGIKPHKIASDEKDENGDTVWKETGKFQITVKTGTTIKKRNSDKVDPKIIKVFNAQGAEVDMGNKRIGNGSKGRLGMVLTLFITNAPGTTKVMSSGLSFYLNRIQLVSLVEYSGGGFDAIDDDELEDGEQFAGAGEVGALAEESESSAKPRLD